MAKGSETESWLECVCLQTTRSAFPIRGRGFCQEGDLISLLEYLKKVTTSCPEVMVPIILLKMQDNLIVLVSEK